MNENYSLLDLVEDSEQSEFYPTPDFLISEMISRINFDSIQTILEPSAGKGDIIRGIARKEGGRWNRSREFDIDCIELDPNLRGILKYKFSDERKKELSHKIYVIENGKTYNRDLGEYEYKNPNDFSEKRKLEDELLTFPEKGIHIVADDFLTYEPFKHYDLIIMNPPFSNGDSHLLKAIDIQKRGGSIICLLNAETLKNPYTERRKALVSKLDEIGAEVEFLQNTFSSAERRTNVEIALIKIHIEEELEESEIFNRFQKAEQVEEFDPDNTELEVTDYIKAAVHRFNVEVKSGIELIRQYKALVPYMSCAFGDDTYDKAPILRLTDSNERGYDSVSINEYLKRVRYKYWFALFKNPKFTAKLTTSLQQKYQSEIDKLQDYDFNEYNISQITSEMNSQIKIGIEKEIIEMFDRLTEEHAWYPETQKNRHYYDGWATNKAHKIDKKVIIPCCNVFDSWDGKPRVYNAQKTLEDIERILNFLDGHMTEGPNFWKTIKLEFGLGNTKNIELKFFKVTFYKKGTVHLVFTCPELIERFNIYAARHKNWLPPSYGKKTYSNMDTKEKAVIDSFQGEAAYNKVYERASYYLSPATDKNTLMLGK